MTRHVAALFAVLIATSVGAAPGRMPELDDPPNVILIVADDIGWSELGCYGNRFNETPHLDRLAREGVRFTQAYAAGPLGTPSRIALMTGQSPLRIGVLGGLPPTAGSLVPDEMLSLAELFQSKGYTTGIAGKWGLSGYDRGRVKSGPGAHGFQSVAVSEQLRIGRGSYFHPYTRVDPKLDQRLPGDTEYLVDRLNLEANDFLAATVIERFFLLKSHYAANGRIVGKPEAVRHFRQKPGAGDGEHASDNNPHLAAQLKAIDEGVGQILDAVAEAGAAERTLLVFTSDNGGDARRTTNGPLRGGKSQLYEGGLRVPLIAWWPARVEGSTVSTTPVVTTDLYATFAELLGAAPPQTIDGRSLLPLLVGKDGDEPFADRTLAWRFPRRKPHFLGGRSCEAVRHGDWKLIRFLDDGHHELYNLAEDPGEQNDLSAAEPGRVNALVERLDGWQ